MFWSRRPSDTKESPRLTPEEAALRDLEFDMMNRLQEERDARVEAVGEVRRLLDVEREHREKQLGDVCRSAGAAASTGSAYARTLEYLGKVQEDVAAAAEAAKERQQHLVSSLEQVLIQQSMQSKHLQQLSAAQEQVLGVLEGKPELDQASAAPAKQEKQQKQKDVAQSTEALMTSLSRLEKQVAPLSRLDKLEPMMERLQSLMEEMPASRTGSQAASSHAGTSSRAATGSHSGDDDYPAEFAGLWHDGGARHVITGRHLHAQSGSGRVELKVRGPRGFSVAGAPKGMGEALLSEDGQSLVWSSGRAWTRAAQQVQAPSPSWDGGSQAAAQEVARKVRVAASFTGATDPDDCRTEPSIAVQKVGSNGTELSVAANSSRPRISARGETSIAMQKVESNGSDSSGAARNRRPNVLQRNRAEEVRLAWLAQRGQIQTEDLDKVRSSLGDALRSMGKPRSATRAFDHLASYADWVEVQRRNRAYERGPRCIDWVVQSYVFEVVAAALILGNAVYIGYTANWFVQHPLASRPESFGYVDLAFFAAFTLELLLRIVSLGKQFLFGPDSVWYALDAILLCVSAVEIAAGGSGGYAWLRTLRAFKLARVIRMVRTISFFKDLRLMMDCMMGSLVSLLWCLVLVVFMLYLFSLIFVQGFAEVSGELMIRLDTEESPVLLTRGEEHGADLVLSYIQERYGSIFKAMLRLWTSTTGGVDWQDEYFLVQLCGDYHAIVFLVFIAFMLIVVWNIVTSTIVEKALRYAQPDIDQLLMEKRRKDDDDVQMLVHMLEKESFDLNGKITREGFVRLLEKRDVAEFLQARGIDIKEAHTFFALIGEEEGVDPVSFILSCLRIKGFATSIDLHTTHHQIMRILQEHSFLLQELHLSCCKVSTLRSSVASPHLLSTMSEVNTFRSSVTSPHLLSTMSGASGVGGAKKHPAPSPSGPLRGRSEVERPEEYVDDTNLTAM